MCARESEGISECGRGVSRDVSSGRSVDVDGV